MALTDAQFKAWLATTDKIITALVEVVARISGVETTLYLSNRNFTTGAAETPASIAYNACICGGLQFTEELGLDGSPLVSYGDIELSNPDGRLDGYLDYVWKNRACSIYIGDPRWPRADFRKVFGGLVFDVAMRQPRVLNIQLTDKLQLLNVPLSETTLGGSTQNKDRIIPVTLGEVHNVTPLLTDPGTRTYRFSDSASERVIEVRDNGKPITTFTTGLSTGSFTLTAEASGAITCSVQGAKPGGTYSNNISTLIQHVALNYGPSATRMVSGDLDSTNLSAFASANTQAVGIYCSDRTNKLAVCQELAASVGAQLVCTTTGLLRLIKVALPASGTPVSVGRADMEWLNLYVSKRVPVKATAKLGYCKNWTTQPYGLAEGLAASSVSAFATEYLTYTATDSTTATTYKLDGQPVQENTCLLTDADATAEAQRRRDLWKTPRSIYTARYFPHMMLTELGDPVTITHDRYGLSGGKTGMVVRINRNWLKARIDIGVLA